MPPHRSHVIHLFVRDDVLALNLLIYTLLFAPFLHERWSFLCCSYIVAFLKIFLYSMREVIDA